MEGPSLHRAAGLGLDRDIRRSVHPLLPSSPALPKCGAHA
jgi:hypothetical protein